MPPPAVTDEGMTVKGGYQVDQYEYINYVPRNLRRTC